MKTPFRIWSRSRRQVAGFADGIARAYQDMARGYRKPLVVSFPKSGRTWLQMMLEGLGVEAEYTHDESDHRKRKLSRDLDASKERYRGHKVVFLMRDPRDVVVSGYFQSTKRIGVYDGDIPGFIRDERHGIEKIISFNQAWLDAGPALPKGLLLVKYEDLHLDAVKELQRIVDFVGCPSIPREKIEEVVLANQFEKMQERERTGAYGDKYGRSLKPGDVRDPESYKVRKGRVGGFVEYLSDGDIAFCDDAMRRLHFDGWYPADSTMRCGSECSWGEAS